MELVASKLNPENENVFSQMGCGFFGGGRGRAGKWSLGGAELGSEVMVLDKGKCELYKSVPCSDRGTPVVLGQPWFLENLSK